MRNNDQSNRIIKWIVTVGDFVVLNAILLGVALWHWRMESWNKEYVEIFILVNNIALMLAMLKFSTIIHLRVVGAGEILKRIIGLTVVGAILAYLLLKVFAYNADMGDWHRVLCRPALQETGGALVYQALSSGGQEHAECDAGGVGS